MPYELVVCLTHDSPASHVVGPFPDRETALAYLALKPPMPEKYRNSSYRWYWGIVGNCTRRDICTVSKPDPWAMVAVEKILALKLLGWGK